VDYSLWVKQTNSGIDSGKTALLWRRDPTAPDTDIHELTAPPAINLSPDARLTFTATKPYSTFECRLDVGAVAGTFKACESPLSLTSLANANYTLNVRAVDVYGNVDPSPDTYSWAQSSSKTVALYHFDSGAPLGDASNYSENDLTDSGTTSIAAASSKFSEGRGFSASSSAHLTAADSESLDLLTGTMTIDFWLKSGSLTNNKDTVIASKTGAANNYGWSLRLRRLGTNVYLVFVGSTDGKNYATEAKSQNCVTNSAAGASFNHYAVTWSKAQVKFYCNGVPKGSGTIGALGSAKLYSSTAALRIGRTETMDSSTLYLDGILDELRFSQVVRYTTTFTPATQAHATD
jgi:hypothetical protein